MIGPGSRLLHEQVPDSLSGPGCRGCSCLWLRLCWWNRNSGIVANTTFYMVLSTVSRTKKGVLTAVEAETCARPNLGTLMGAGAILALLQVVLITRKWRELRAGRSLEGWCSVFRAQLNTRRTTSSLNGMGSNINNTIIAT